MQYGHARALRIKGTSEEISRHNALDVLACRLRTVRCDRAGNLGRAKATLDSIYKWYGVDGSFLLRENYPFDADYKAG